MVGPMKNPDGSPAKQVGNGPLRWAFCCCEKGCTECFDGRTVNSITFTTSGFTVVDAWTPAESDPRFYPPWAVLDEGGDLTELNAAINGSFVATLRIDPQFGLCVDADDPFYEGVSHDESFVSPGFVNEAHDSFGWSAKSISPIAFPDPALLSFAFRWNTGHTGASGNGRVAATFHYQIDSTSTPQYFQNGRLKCDQLLGLELPLLLISSIHINTVLDDYIDWTSGKVTITGVTFAP